MPLSELHPPLSVKPLIFESEEQARSIVDPVFQHPGIAARIGHDHRQPGYIHHPAVSYLGAYVRDSLVGLFMRIRVSPIEADLHVALLPAAARHSRKLGRLCLDYVFSINTQLRRVTAYVIENLVSAKNYCLKLGFVLEGLRRDACMQNGQLFGVYVMGMTRSDWEAGKWAL